MDDKKPCGRKADWIVIGDVLDGGEGFVATCRECYQKGVGRIWPETNDDLVTASAFKENFGRDPMCGDDDESNGLFHAMSAIVEKVKETQLSHQEFALWRVERELKARIHRVAIHRRFDRIESSIRILASLVSACVALLVYDRAKKWIPWGELGSGIVLVCVAVLTDRFIRLGRLTKHLKIR